MVEDPDNFQSAIEKDEEATMLFQKRQEAEDEALARDITERERQIEKNREGQIQERERLRGKRIKMMRRQEEEDEALARRVSEGERQVEQDRRRRNDEAEAEAVRRARARADQDEMLAREMMERERQLEQHRQRQKHEEQLRHARQEQEAEGRRMRDAEQAQRKAAIKRKNQEEKMSLATVRATTKNCPGCRWPIEKNDGCSHMTCKPISVMFRANIRTFISEFYLMFYCGFEKMPDSNRHTMPA